MHWPSFRVLSAMVPRPAVRRRLPPAWRRASWGITCTKTASSSAVGMASSQRALKIPSVMWDCWAVRGCAKPIKRSCGSCCRSRKAAAVEDRDYLQEVTFIPYSCAASCSHPESCAFVGAADADGLSCAPFVGFCPQCGAFAGDLRFGVYIVLAYFFNSCGKHFQIPPFGKQATEKSKGV